MKKISGAGKSSKPVSSSKTPNVKPKAVETTTKVTKPDIADKIKKDL